MVYSHPVLLTLASPLPGLKRLKAGLFLHKVNGKHLLAHHSLVGCRNAYQKAIAFFSSLAYVRTCAAASEAAIMRKSEYGLAACYEESCTSMIPGTN